MKSPGTILPRHQNGRNVGMAQLPEADCLSWMGIQKLPAHEKPRHNSAAPSKRPKRRDGETSAVMWLGLLNCNLIVTSKTTVSKTVSRTENPTRNSGDFRYRKICIENVQTFPKQFTKNVTKMPENHAFLVPVLLGCGASGWRFPLAM